MSVLNPVVDYQKANLKGQEFVESSLAKVLVLYTGGTIGMKQTDNGYQPAEGWLYDTLAKTQKFHQAEVKLTSFQQVKYLKHGKVGEKPMEFSLDLPLLQTPKSIYGKKTEYAILEYTPLLDSANMTMDEWIKIGSDIELNYSQFDAFLVLHGTDTMAYTASALSYMFEHLGKTVILTGSQVPLSEWKSDAEENFLGALLMAGHFVIPEVCVFFNNKLFRGNRVVKVDAIDFVAFDSPNLKPLATIGVNIDVNWRDIRRPTTTGRFTVARNLCKNVAILKLYPNMSLATLSAFLSVHIEGLVIETFGAGNAPSNRSDLMDLLKKTCERGIIIVNCTQCKRGMVSDVYETGKALSKIGIISGSDMSPESAFTKLSYLLGKGLNPEETKQLVLKNLRGELTVLPLPFQKTEMFTFRYIDSLVEAMGYSSPSERSLLEKSILPQVICAIIASNNAELLDNVCVEENISTIINIQDYCGNTCLHIAARQGNPRILKKLLNLGANVHIRNFNNASVLGIACSLHNEEAAKLLHETGANIYFDDVEAQLCFQRAVMYGDINKVELFLEIGGFDVNRKLIHGQTALHIAYIYGQYELIEVLLSFKKVDERIMDLFGKTPVEYSNESKRIMNFYIGDEIGLLKVVGFEENENSEIKLCSSEIHGSPQRVHQILSINASDSFEELIICRRSGYIDILNVNTKKPLKTFHVKDGDFVDSYFYDNHWLAGTKNGVIYTGLCTDEEKLDEEIKSFKVGLNLSHVKMAADRLKIAVGGHENDLAVYDLVKPEQPLFKAKNVKRDFLDLRVPVEINDLAFCNSGINEIATINLNKMRIYDIRTGKRPVNEVKVHDLSPLKLGVRVDKQQFYYSLNTGVVQFLDMKNLNKKLFSFKESKGTVTDFCCLEGKPTFFGTVGSDRYFRLYDLGKKKLVQKVYLKQRLTCLVGIQNESDLF